MSFLRRKINLTFRLGRDTNGVQYTFTEGDFDTVTVEGLRIQATIANAGPPSMGQASIVVHGLTSSLQNQLSSVTRLNDGQIATRFAQMVVEAGDDTGMSTIFQGQVSLAQIDASGAPDIRLNVAAHAGLYEAVKTAAPMSFPGVADVATIMQNLATQNGYAFENSGVKTQLWTPYFHGSPRQQMEACAAAANINWALDSGTLAIWPKGASRNAELPLISTSTGMIGYPSNQGLGGSITVKTLFNPQLIIGRPCQVQSSLPFANGNFVMFQVSHDLESETPNGLWETSFTGSPFNAPSQ
jgi:hypothetical protein